MLSSVARKAVMALTGLFLCLFLVIHLLGNLQLFLPPGQAQLQFNLYASLLAHSPIIEVAAIVTYVSIVGHVLLSLWLTIRNRQSAGARYQATASGSLSPWYSRMMGMLGVVILIFLIIHLQDFWYPFKFGKDIGIDSEERRDLFGLVVKEFGKGWKIALYELGVLAIGFHVAHGFYSGLRSLGLHYPGYARWLRVMGFTLSIAVTLGFGAMPIFLYFRY